MSLTTILSCLLFVSCLGGKVLESYLNHAEWWLVKNITTANVYFRHEDTLMFLRHADLDSYHIHSCYEYVMLNKYTEMVVKSRSFCFPSVVVGGYKKCSTSALYEFLMESPAFSAAKGKEICMMKKSMVELFDWFPAEITDDKYFINGCIYWEYNYVIHEILRHPNTFYLLIYRNYADYLWSAYNYWCSIPYDSRCTFIGEWVQVGKFIRSPEIFEDLVQAAVNNRSMVMPHYMVDSCNVGRQLFSNYTFSMWRSGVPPDSTLLLANEELDSNPERVWHRISIALGITHPHPQLEQFSHLKINANIKKGGKAAVDASKVTPGLYEISHFQPMLNKTRHTLDRCWMPDCQFVSSLTEHPYPVCQAVTEPVKYSDSDSKLIETYKATRLNATFSVDHSFAQVKINQCRDLKERLTHNHSDKKSVVKSMVLLLSTSKARQTLGMFLSHYLTSDHHMSTLDVENTEGDKIDGDFCHTSPSGATFISAHPDNVTLEIAANNTTELFVKFGGSVCPVPVRFHQVILLLDEADDILLHAWKTKQDVVLWRRNVVSQVKHFTDTTRTGLWTRQLSMQLDALVESQMLVLKMREIRKDRVHNYQNVAGKLLNFLFVKQSKPSLSSVITSLPQPSDFAVHQALDLLYCAHVKVLEAIRAEKDREDFRRSWMESTAVLVNDTRAVYSNVSLVCEVERYLRDKKIALTSLRETVSGVSYCDLTQAEVVSLSAATSTHGGGVPKRGPKRVIPVLRMPTRKPVTMKISPINREQVIKKVIASVKNRPKPVNDPA